MELSNATMAALGKAAEARDRYLHPSFSDTAPTILNDLDSQIGMFALAAEKFYNEKVEARNEQ